MEIKHEHLWTACDRCSGKRTVEEGIAQGSVTPYCMEVCLKCKGTGKVLTEHGKVLKAFACLIYDGDILANTRFCIPLALALRDTKSQPAKQAQTPS